MEQWYLLDEHTVVERLQTSPRGLTEGQAAERLQQYGLNQLEERRLRSAWVVLSGQFTGVMVIVLLVAAVLSLFLGEAKDAIVIMIIVVLNAILGFTQEYRAERAMDKLEQLAVRTVRVRRGDQIREVEATQLVPGDIALIEAGARILADARVLESANLRVEEAALTGESMPVEKVSHAISGDSIPVGDRRNMLFMGTTVSYGRGLAVVTDTGMKTELGNIAHLLQEVSEGRTPLQRRMAELGKTRAAGALVIVAIALTTALQLGVVYLPFAHLWRRGSDVGAAWDHGVAQRGGVCDHRAVHLGAPPVPAPALGAAGMMGARL